ncbi:MinD/ParA family protein [Aquibacillus koreensis]|uniref:MinD/ParA family protein n=1 Tax=Aquibacillus koreensis TaxID=279446 RepID=A0A9X3WLF8_9BACI|nr:MinD/ParA family protein [Aquibacillus koreensis]MCT2534541.1 MinD/ParA family protein [Aquibacillus koreensis]MDC3421865.1 MinD/ParA family protein [Aquibacillus koreensis]
MSDQAAKLRRKLELLRNKRHAKTIAVISGKGGVGKSNFALNFSLGLLKKGKKVLIFDLDIGMGNIDILLGLSAKQSIANMFTHNLSIHDIIEVGPNSLSYIAAGSGLSDIFTMDQQKFTYFLDQLEDLMTSYDYIIFDMGAGITHGSLYYMLAADECIVITTPEPTSMTDAYAIIKHITNHNFNLPLLVLVNRIPNFKTGQEALERLQKVVQRFLHRDIIPLGLLPEDKTVVKAVTSQTPFMIYNPAADVSLALSQIVDQYVSDSINISETVPFSFVKRLKQLITER